MSKYKYEYDENAELLI